MVKSYAEVAFFLIADILANHMKLKHDDLIEVIIHKMINVVTVE